MCTIKETVEITTSIMTEIGSRRMPKSIWSLSVKCNHSKLKTVTG